MLAISGRRRQKPVDKTLLTIMLMLMMLGLLTLFSATYYKAQDAGDPLSEVKKQLSGMAVDIAEQMVSREINAEDQDRLVDEFIRNAGDKA